MSTRIICGNCSLKPTQQYNRTEWSASNGPVCAAIPVHSWSHNPIETKAHGKSGTFDELLAKAQLEEACIKEVEASKTQVGCNTNTLQAPSDGGRTQPQSSQVTCYKRGDRGHFARVPPHEPWTV